MQDPSDYQLDHADSPLPPGPPRPRAVWPWLAGLVALVAVILAIVLLRRDGSPPQTESLALDAPGPAPTPGALPDGSLGAPAEPIDVPPLDESDSVVRTLVAALSSHPRLTQWLATDGLIRTFTVSVENIASGQTPAVHVPAARPRGAFQAIDEEDVVLVDPRSYERYTEIADVFASIDAQGAARLYTGLKPRIEQAYRELGHPESFDRAMERTIVSLLEVPVLSGDVALEPRGAVYQFADPRLEALTGAQKQLLRMGPRNVRLIQTTLRELAQALGIQSSRLPA
jgi:hypothetical protein